MILVYSTFNPSEASGLTDPQPELDSAALRQDRTCSSVRVEPSTRKNRRRNATTNQNLIWNELRLGSDWKYDRHPSRMCAANRICGACCNRSAA